MRRFPFSRLRLRHAWITASLGYFPFRGIPPTVSHNISIEMEPLELGADAAMPEYEKVVESGILISGLVFDDLRWDQLSGSYRLDENHDGSFYVSHVHNPVTLRTLNLQYREGVTYDMDAAATVHFEVEGSGYADESTRFVCKATHRGFVFCVPHWAEPDTMTFPEEWNIPSAFPDWPEPVIREFAGRYCDLSQFASIVIKDGILSASPSPVYLEPQ